MISIIIPIFNCYEYLEQCITSVLKQTYENFELLLIDDGSTDNSKDICLKFQKEDKRVKYFYKENSGVSDTRNYGLNCANGEYVLFIDSDDYLLNEYVLEKCVEAKNNNIFATIIFNFSYVNDFGIVAGRKMSLSKYNEFDVIANLIGGANTGQYFGAMFRAVWGKLLDLNIIKQNNIEFEKDMYMGEDAIFLMRYFKICKNIVAIDEPLYGYRIRNDSACRKFKKDLFTQHEIEISKMREIIPSTDDSVIQSAYAAYVLDSFWGLIMNDKKNKCEKHKYKNAFSWLNKNNEYLLLNKVKTSLLGKRNRIYIYIYITYQFLNICLQEFFALKLNYIKLTYQSNNNGGMLI